MVAEVAAAGLCAIALRPNIPVAIFFLGGLLGTVGGILQHLGFVEGSARFLGTATLWDVRKVFRDTRWGNRFIYWIYVSKTLLLVASVFILWDSFVRILIAYIGGYACFMLIREAITLRDAYELENMARSNADAA